jgi:hypothetical protein
MQIITVAPKTAVNPFASDIAELAKATESNAQAAGTWAVPSAEAGKSKYKIGKAANAINLTAALVSETVEKKDGKPTGNIVLTFRLKGRHQSTTRIRTPKPVETTSK